MSNNKSKPWVALMLAAHLATGTVLAGASPGQAGAVEAALPGTPYTAGGAYDVSVPHVMINQVYGGGLAPAADTYASHRFIELYNPTDQDIDLTGWSLQYADRGSNAKTGPTGAWQKLDLSGTIPAHSSFLITGEASGAANPAPQLTLAAKSDLSWSGRFINNKGLKVVLMSSTELLTDVNPYLTKPPGYVDMLGTASNDEGSDIDGYETSYPSGGAEGTSKKKAVVRRDRTDSDNNKLDFAQFDYSTAAPQELAAGAPRGSIDGEWGTAADPLGLADITVPTAYEDVPYSVTFSAYGGKAPYTYSASGLPAGLQIDSTAGTLSGTPAPEAAGEYTVSVTVTDSAYAVTQRTVPFTVQAGGIKDRIRMTKIGGYSVGTTNEDGGVAEIIKYNKDNGKFYLVNGSTNPPSLDIVSLRTGQEMSKDATVNVKALSETGGFVYGDLTSVDINTATQRIAVSVQEADFAKKGRILVLDYDGALLQTYEAGVQPDMIKFTSDGRYILTADEGEPREADSAETDPHGSVTIVDTLAEDTHASVTHVKFDHPDVIDDGVLIRGAYGSPKNKILGPGSKQDALFDLEPEYITLSEDGSRAYVSLQENNAMATIDIAARSVLSVKGLGFKDWNDPRNPVDVIKDGRIHMENVPFQGVYMPDGISSYTVNGATYLLSANEGDGTEWDFRENVSTVKDLKGSLTAGSAAARFLEGKTAYDKVEAVSGIRPDGIYMFGARSFSIWNTTGMTQVYDSGSDFEQITAQRLPNHFNTSNSKTAPDDRSAKKGPEPEGITLGKVGDRILAFVGLERIGGIMTYDVTNPAHAGFVNYTNTRDFTLQDPLATDTGPEGIEFIPASDSPTGLPLLLVASEVGGTVAVLQIEEPQLTLDQPELALKVGGSPAQLKVQVTPSDAEAEITWSSSNPAAAAVSSSGIVTPVAPGSTRITAATASGYGTAFSEVTVTAADSVDSGGGTDHDDSDESSDGGSSSASGGGVSAGGTAPIGSAPVVTSNGNSQVLVTLSAAPDGAGKASISAGQVNELLKAVEQAAAEGKSAGIVFKVTGGDSTTRALQLAVPGAAFAAIAKSKAAQLTVSTALGSLAFDRTALAAIPSAGEDEDVTVGIAREEQGTLSAGLPEAARETIGAAIGSRPVFTYTVVSGRANVSAFGGGKVNIHMPYQAAAGEGPDSLVGYRLTGDSLEVLPYSFYDAAADTLILRVDHLSRYAAGYNPLHFEDMGSSFARPHTSFLAARGIVNGTLPQMFSPQAPVTRADLAVMLARMAGAGQGTAQGTSFADVPADAYYAAAVQWAVDTGITDGVRETEFAPQAPVTREQMAAMLVRYASAMKHALPRTAFAVPFADQSSIPAYAQDASQALQQAGIVEGKSYTDRTGSFFAGADAVTREEAAKMLSMLLKRTIQ
ncbi:choice-of-anchor I family protein [Paenibacillus caseinilyticus]|uniref:Uncharacterized protein n=1 Tax=Paenibacillus mucilaginosus K02 TaxID=997761 RepID=I0BKN8_9BACL|nr:choice-of-anchor I family protein [Paenibacillus mucilaginosus]AFH62935.2 hypothetical protein B2K_19840 [Paenibacillus mucilaginosus K02]